MPPTTSAHRGRAVYAISVAAELVGSVPQNLRLYEARGLVRPARSDGGTRRYSDDDLLRLRQILELLAAGVNLAGIEIILDLQASNDALRAELARRGDGAGPARAGRGTGGPGEAGVPPGE